MAPTAPAPKHDLSTDPKQVADDGQTTAGQDGKSAPRLPHERDQSADSQSPDDAQPTEVGQQAHEDVERGLVDTDRGPELERLSKRLSR